MGGVAWTEEEDQLLKKCIEQYGEGKWHRVPLLAGLNRCRKSCRLRWLNYLRPNIKRGSFTEEEVQLIIKLHKLLGNRWSLIAGRLPGRTANDVKNYWNCHLSKRLNAQATASEKENAINLKTIRPLQPLGTSSKMPRTPDIGPNNNIQAMVEESSILSTAPFQYVEVDDQLRAQEEVVKEEESKMSMAFQYVEVDDQLQGQEALVKEEESNMSMAFQYVEVDDQLQGQEVLMKEEENSCLAVTVKEPDAGIVGDFGTDHLGQIHELNILGSNHGSCKLDWDDLIVDMDLWTNSL